MVIARDMLLPLSKHTIHTMCSAMKARISVVLYRREFFLREELLIRTAAIVRIGSAKVKLRWKLILRHLSISADVV